MLSCSVIAQFNASQLITQREQVSGRIKQQLTDRAKNFNIIIDDVSITHLTFGAEYTAAVEAKQIAQQDAERARYLVKQAIQDKKSTIIKAQGEAKSAEMIGDALKKNPGYIELRQLDAARSFPLSHTSFYTQSHMYTSYFSPLSPISYVYYMLIYDVDMYDTEISRARWQIHRTKSS